MFQSNNYTAAARQPAIFDRAEFYERSCTSRADSSIFTLSSFSLFSSLSIVLMALLKGLSMMCHKIKCVMRSKRLILIKA